MRVASGRMTDVDPASLTPAESVGSPDEAPPPPRAARRPGAKTGMAALTVGALGVVFGDIGTSPLYALQTVFSADHHAVRATQAGVYGVISLVFWTITIIVSVKYVTFIMRADNEGEGGIMALIALIQRGVRLQRRSAKAALVALGIFGASLFYGDGMITPAISVLSAVEGLEVAAPSLEHLVVHHAGHPHGALRRPALRDRRGGAGLRAGHGDLVRAPRAVRTGQGRRAPRDPARDLAVLRAQLPLRARPRRLHRAGLGRAHGHGSRGPLRGHGPLRSPPDQARVVRHRLPRPDPQLHGPGGPDPRLAARRRQPLLPALPALGADPDGPRRHRRDGHLLAGRHLRG